MSKSYVAMTFDGAVSAALYELTEPIRRSCPSPCVGKGVTMPTALHLTVYYGFHSSVTVSALQAYLNQFWPRHALVLHGLTLDHHMAGRSKIITVIPKSHLLYRLNTLLKEFPGALPPKYLPYRPHISLAEVVSGYRLPVLGTEFDSGEVLGEPVVPDGLWFVTPETDTLAKTWTHLELPV